MARELVQAHPNISDADKARFKEDKPVIGKCPRCGGSVYEGRKNYYCGNRDCAFTMWKNDRFFEERKTAFTPKIAAALLKDGKAKVKKLYSPKTGKTYDGIVLLADTGGKYVNYRATVSRDKELTQLYRGKCYTKLAKERQIVQGLRFQKLGIIKLLSQAV